MPPKPKVSQIHQPSAKIDTAAFEALWQLYSPHHNVEKLEFYERIYKKMDHITRYFDKVTGELVGMTGVRHQDFKLSNGMKVYTVYNGMSFINPIYRGLHLLPQTLAFYGMRLKRKHLFGHIYLWSDAISYKPYVLMARSTRVFYPSRKRATPPHIAELIQLVGKKFYGESFDPEACVVRKESNRLKDYVAPITEVDLQDPDINFYTQKNPGYKNGDGLINVIPLTWLNMATSMMNAMRKSGKKRKPNSTATQKMELKNENI